MTTPLMIKRKLYQAQAMLDEQNFTRAIQILRQLKQDAPQMSQIQVLLGQAYMGNNNTGKAISLFEDLVATDPQNLHYLGCLGQSYLLRGWYKRAINPFKQAIALDGENPLHWIRLNDAYVAGQEYRQAQALLRTALSRDHVGDYFALVMYQNIFINELRILTDLETYNEGPMMESLKDVYRLGATMSGEKHEIAMSLYGAARHLAKYYANHIMQTFESTREILTVALALSPGNEEIKQFKEKIDCYRRVEGEYTNLGLDNDYGDEFIVFIASKLFPISDPDEDAYISLIEYNFLQGFDHYKEDILMLGEEYPKIYEALESYFEQMAYMPRRNKQIAKIEQFFDKNQDQLEMMLLQQLAEMDLDEDEDIYFDYEWDDK